MSSPNDVAFFVGAIPVMLSDVARAIAVHEGNGEAMKDPDRVKVLKQDARDILDRAFRFAQESRSIKPLTYEERGE